MPARRNITVIGAGIVGLTTAYYLAKNGHRVTIIDKAKSVATGASAANGFQLSYAYLAPPFTLADVFKQVRHLLLGTDPQTAISHISRKSLWQNARWFLAALWQALPPNYRRNHKHILALGQQSHFLLQAFLASDGKDFQFEYSEQGKLVVFDHPHPLNKNLKATQFIAQHTGYQFKAFTPEACFKYAPFLKTMVHPPIAGGVYNPHDFAGNCPQFCTQLAALLKTNYGVTFNLGVKAAPLNTLAADAVVLCAGAESKELLKPLGIYAPLYPVKGYSYTLKKCGGQKAYVTHKAKGMVISDMGTTTRISGFADFVGVDTTTDNTREAALLRQIEGFFPKQKLQILAQNVGLRPVTPHGLPIVKKTGKNIYLNIGHGMFGWTLAHATAFKLAELFETNNALPLEKSPLIGHIRFL